MTLIISAVPSVGNYIQRVADSENETIRYYGRYSESLEWKIAHLWTETPDFVSFNPTTPFHVHIFYWFDLYSRTTLDWESTKIEVNYRDGICNVRSVSLRHGDQRSQLLRFDPISGDLMLYIPRLYRSGIINIERHILFTNPVLTRIWDHNDWSPELARILEIPTRISGRLDTLRKRHSVVGPLGKLR